MNLEEKIFMKIYLELCWTDMNFEIISKQNRIQDIEYFLH